MTIREDIISLLNENNIPFLDTPNYISCKEDKYRLYVIEEDEILKYSWNEVSRNYFLEISKNNELVGIHTVWVKSFEWKDERKKNVLMSGILSDLGVIKNRYFGRQCFVEEIKSTEAQKFLEKHCFYGRRGASLTLGLRSKKTNELLMLMSFGASHYAKNKWDCEVIRASTKLNSQVVGGASKLFKHFLEKHTVMKIGDRDVEINTVLFYVDYDHKQGNSMSALGYEFVGYTGHGFHNFCLKDCVFGKKGDMFMRKPHRHQEVMECIRNEEVVSICNSGNKIYVFDRSKNITLKGDSMFIGE